MLLLQGQSTELEVGENAKLLHTSMLSLFALQPSIKYLKLHNTENATQKFMEYAKMESTVVTVLVCTTLIQYREKGLNVNMIFNTSNRRTFVKAGEVVEGVGGWWTPNFHIILILLASRMAP